MVISMIVVAGCASSHGRVRTPPSAPAEPVTTGWSEQGLASWYGEPYHGRPTASGERYDMKEMTAAHRTLPFGTRLRVRNLDNHRETEVLVNDRGPFVEGRILDLSWAAARALDALGPGVVPIRLTVVSAGDGMLGEPCWEVQIGAFARSDNVEHARANLAQRGFAVRLAPASGGLTRVRATGLAGRSGALETAGQLRSTYPGAVAVPCGGGR